MSEAVMSNPVENTKFLYGEHIHIRPKGDHHWTVSYIENVIDGKPVLAMPEAYAQAMLIEAVTFECYTNSNGKYQFFTATIENMRLEKPALITLSKPQNPIIKDNARVQKRLIVNMLAEIHDENGLKISNAIVRDISPTGLALTFNSTPEVKPPLLISLHMPVRNFFKNIVRIKGKSVWSYQRANCTHMGISMKNDATENSRLLNFFYNYHLNA